MPLSELWEMILYLSPRSNTRIFHIAECGILVLRIREVLLSCWIICLNQNNVTINANHNLPPANYFLITLRSNLHAQAKGNSEIWCTQHLLCLKSIVNPAVQKFLRKADKRSELTASIHYC